MINNENKGSGRMMFSLIEIHREIINEVLDFDNVSKYKLTPTTDGWSFTAKINSENVEVFIYVEPAPISDFDVSHWYKNAKNVVNFGFEIGNEKISNQYKRTNFKDYIKILATVGSALDKLIQTDNVELITLFSDSKYTGHNPDPQKDNIYFAALENNLPAGYDIGDVFYKKTRKKGIMIVKKDYFK